jgi:DNA-binding transcriptional ArsR family regulator
MVEYSLGDTLHALSHETRRALLARLGEGEATISELAAPMPMTFFAVSKHLRVLERAGLVERTVRGREHWFALRPEPVDAAAAWMTEQSRRWNERLDSLERYLRARRPPKGEER